MLEALEEAKKAFTFGEVPVGAVAVYEGSIVARTFNKVESLRDASAHAELLCLREAAEVLGRWRLSGVTLYTTLEPCCMCAGALLCFRIDRLVWGAPDIRQGADGSFASLLSLKHPIHEITITRNILSESSSLLMKTFFEQSMYEEILDELVDQQRKRLGEFARKFIPCLTEDDLLQPNDFPELENHPYFRYEEGVLEGILTARMAYLAQKNQEVK